MKRQLKDRIPGCDGFVSSSIVKYFSLSYSINRKLCIYGLYGDASVRAESVVLLTSAAPLLKKMNFSQSIDADVHVYSQPIAFGSLLYLLKKLLTSTAILFLLLVRNRPRQAGSESRKPHIGVSYVWGLEGQKKNDLYWWYKSGIAPDRLCYLYDRTDYKASTGRTEIVKGLGIENVILDRRSIDNDSTNYLKTFDVCWLPVFQILINVWAAGVRGIFCNCFDRLVCSEYVYLDAKSFYYGSQLSTLGIKGLFHYQEASHDHISLACERTGVARFGIHWSVLNGPSNSSTYAHQVYFFWGMYQAKIGLSSNMLSRHVMLTGSMVNEFRECKDASGINDEIKELVENGCRYILALFDSSQPAPNLYDFFIRWLLDDPALGILVKSKVGAWDSSFNDENKKMVEQALDTGRLVILDPNISPADAASGVDIAVGIGSPSAIVDAALGGSRAVYLDYECVEKGPLKKYAILHSMGDDRCVFHETGRLKKVFMEYFSDNSSHPDLGDMRPVLDQYDPFRDGRAVTRIGDYIRWYMAGLDDGQCKDDALNRATGKYADKWGKENVVRGLE